MPKCFSLFRTCANQTTFEVISELNVHQVKKIK